jgi:hypothetical protein
MVLGRLFSQGGHDERTDNQSTPGS